MNDTRRVVYIVSDLHIGGRYPNKDAPNDRGFRMNTHVDTLTRFVRTRADRCSSGLDVELIINGDFLDFLAEENPDTGEFTPFVDDPVDAIRRLQIIVNRDRPLFDALEAFVGCGGRLTLLLGNHDVELALPRVRRELFRLLRIEGSSRVTFLFDGEAYVVGDALIEHGNRYDGFNVVDHDKLRRVRSLQSRSQPVPPEKAFSAPPGSHLVASIMNPIKPTYPFVDLLKPERETVVPILLALEPDYRNKILKVLKLKREADRHEPIAPAMPRYGGDLAASGSRQRFDGDLVGRHRDDELTALLRSVMPPDAFARFAAILPPAPTSGDLAAGGGLGTLWSLMPLLKGGKPEDLDKRLPALLDALRVLEKDRSFDDSCETDKAYFDAACELSRRGYRFVVFGHTHLAKHVDLAKYVDLAKHVDLGGGRAYLNSGTWADLMRFPKGIVQPDNPRAMEELRDFAVDLAARRLEPYIEFRPTYVRLDVHGEHVVQADMLDFDSRRDGIDS